MISTASISAAQEKAEQPSIEQTETVVAVIDPSSATETISTRAPKTSTTTIINDDTAVSSSSPAANPAAKLSSTFPSPNSTGKSIDEQLAEAAAFKQQRRLEMSSGSLSGGGTSTLGKLLTSLKLADRQTVRLALVTLSLVSSFFGAILLVIAGADPPTRSSSLYSYSDLMRLMSAIHERSVEIVPNSLSRREWIEALKNGTLMETTAEKWRELLSEWWPIRPVDFASADVILEEGNFWARHYRTFQGAFIVFCCLGQAVLLLTWAYFLAAKELRAGRRHNEELLLRVNGNGSHRAKSRVKSPKLLSERVSETWAKTKRAFGGGGGHPSSSLSRLKKSWFDDPRRPWERPAVQLVSGLLLTDLLLFSVLLCRPSAFTLVLHQTVFVLLAVLCLASTQEEEKALLHFERKSNGSSFNGSSASLPTSREALPQSLRSNGNGSLNSQRKSTSIFSQNNGGTSNKVHQSPSEMKGATSEPLIEEEEAISGTPIFVTEQSANLQKPSGFSLRQSQPPSPQPSLNPFGSFDEEEEDEKFAKRKVSPLKRQSIDEEAEKEVEQV